MRRSRVNNAQEQAAKRRSLALVLLVGLLLLGVGAEIVQAVEVQLPTKEDMVYGDFPVVGRRVAVWVIAQLHLMFGAFVVGVPLFILIIEILGAATKNQQYDDLAHEFTRLLSVAFSTTAIFGGILVFFLIGLYPTFMNFLASIFFPSMVIYVFLFFGESFSMYLYYFGWDSLKGASRNVGAVIGHVGPERAGAVSGAAIADGVALPVHGRRLVGELPGVVRPGRGAVRRAAGARAATGQEQLRAKPQVDAHLLWHSAQLLRPDPDDDLQLVGDVHDLAGGDRSGRRGVLGHHLGRHAQLHVDAGQPAPLHRQHRLWRLGGGGIRGVPFSGGKA